MQVYAYEVDGYGNFIFMVCSALNRSLCFRSLCPLHETLLGGVVCEAHWGFFPALLDVARMTKTLCFHQTAG